MKKFTRKWNAFRHVIDIHGCFASISNHKGLVFINDDFSVNGFASKDHLSENKKEEELDQRVLEIYGYLIKSFEELEKLCSHYPEPERIKYLANHIVMAILSPDPLKAINNAINLIRKLNGKAKLVHYVSKSYGMNPVQAESYLTNLIKSSRYISDVKVAKLRG
jgi:hypothetical protein